MNELLGDTRAYRQSNKTSPLNVMACTQSASATTASTSPRTCRHQPRPSRPPLGLAACRAGDTLVVTKLDWLARSLPDARDILDELTNRDGKLSLGGSVLDLTDPVGRLLFNVLAMVAEFSVISTRRCSELPQDEGVA
jgi:hypothetical protein